MKSARVMLVVGLFGLAILWVFLMGLVSLVGASAKSRGGTAPLEDGSVKAQITSLERKGFDISLNVKITDGNGKVIEQLGDQDIEVYEDGELVGEYKLTPAGKAPLRLCLVIDFSRSMNGRKTQEARNAARALLRMMQDYRDFVSIHFINDGLFDRKADERVKMAPLDLERREQAWEAIVLTPLGEGTPMLGTIARGLDGLATVNGRRVMIVLTDGMDTDADGIPANKATVFEKCKELEVPLYMISTSSEAGDEKAMRELASTTGGEYFGVPKPEDLKNIFLGIGQSIKNEYGIEYESPNPVEDGTQRNVKVIVRSGRSGAVVGKQYKVPGVVGVGGGSKKTGGTSGTSMGSLAIVFVCLTGMLGLLFAVPPMLKFLSVPVDESGTPVAAPSPAPQAGHSRPTVPPAPPKKPKM